MNYHSLRELKKISENLDPRTHQHQKAAPIPKSLTNLSFTRETGTSHNNSVPLANNRIFGKELSNLPDISKNRPNILENGVILDYSGFRHLTCPFLLYRK